MVESGFTGSVFASIVLFFGGGRSWLSAVSALLALVLLITSVVLEVVYRKNLHNRVLMLFWTPTSAAWGVFVGLLCSPKFSVLVSAAAGLGAFVVAAAIFNMIPLIDIVYSLLERRRMRKEKEVPSPR